MDFVPLQSKLERIWGMADFNGGSVVYQYTIFGNLNYSPQAHKTQKQCQRPHLKRLLIWGLTVYRQDLFSSIIIIIYLRQAGYWRDGFVASLLYAVEMTYAA